VPGIFSIFRLWQISSGYVENLGRALFISSQFDTRISSQIEEVQLEGIRGILAEGYCPKNLWHDRLLLQRGDGVNTIIDLGFL
jgi:hypothetical protein